MRYRDKPATNETEKATITPPSHCPTCRSRNISTVSKVVTAASYWRCEACGDVWNVGRRNEGDRYSDWRSPRP